MILLKQIEADTLAANWITVLYTSTKCGTRYTSNKLIQYPSKNVEHGTLTIIGVPAIILASKLVKNLIMVLQQYIELGTQATGA
jgi:hypothetical protein